MNPTDSGTRSQSTPSHSQSASCDCDRDGLVEVVLLAVGLPASEAGEQDRFIQFTRPDHQKAGGMCGFPGGKVEAGESLEEAAQRETLEELGLRVVKAVWVGCGEFREWGAHSTLMLCEVEDIEDLAVDPTEAAEWRWLSLPELINHPRRMNSNAVLGAALARHLGA